MNEQTTVPPQDGCFIQTASEDVPSFKTRLRRKIFPSKHGNASQKAIAKDVKFQVRDCYVCRIMAELSMVDRIRILVSGRLVVDTITYTENQIGEHVVGSECWPLPPKFLER